MPTYIRPARVDITERGGGGGGLVLIAAAVVAAAAVIAFVLAHIVVIAVCAGAFTAVMGSVAVWFRWLASPARLARHYHPRPTVRVLASRPAQAIPAPQQRAIEAPRRQPPARAARPVIIHVRRPR